MFTALKSPKDEAERGPNKSQKKLALLGLLNDSKDHNIYQTVLYDQEPRHSVSSKSGMSNVEAHTRKAPIEPVDMNMGNNQAPSSGPNIPPCVILHYSPFKAIWDWITLILVLYIALATPYFAAFHSTSSSHKKRHQQNNLSQDISLMSFEAFNSSNYNDSEYKSSYTIIDQPEPSRFPTISIQSVVDLFVDTMFIADILINFRTTYLCDGEVVTEPGKIAINYIKGWFIIDLIAAIPFDFLLFRVSTDRITLMGVLKAARLLRLLRVARRIDQYSEYGAAVLILLMGTFVLISHWLACVFYAIAYYERLMPDALKIGWLDGLANKTGNLYINGDPQSGPDTSTRYITSLYFTFTILTSVGFGNVAAVTNSEKVFTIVAMMVGSLLSAAIFGNVSSIMLRLYQGTEDYFEMQTRIKEFIRFHRIPKDLADRLVESFQHSRSCAQGVDMNSVLKGFPECLQADICLHLNRILLTSCDAFNGASQGCLRALSIKFKSTHCPPGDTLIHPGDILDCIYFIARGTIEVLADDVIMAILGKGDIIGDDPFVTEGQKEKNKKSPFKALTAKSSYSVRAISYCDLHTISVADLNSILEAYPEFSGKFVQNFKATFNLKKGTPLLKKCIGNTSTAKLKEEKNKSTPLTAAHDRITNMRKAFSKKLQSTTKKAEIEESKSLVEEKEEDKNTIVTLSPNQPSETYAQEAFRPIQSSSSSNKRTKKDVTSWVHTSFYKQALERPASMTTHFQNGDINHTIDPAVPIKWHTAEAPSETSSFLSCSNSSPCKYSEVESLFNALQHQQRLMNLDKKGSKESLQISPQTIEPELKDIFDNLSMEHSSKMHASSDIVCVEKDLLCDLQKPQKRLQPAPFEKINRRLKEINKRMWKFERNLFSAVDSILEMLENLPPSHPPPQTTIHIN